MKIMKEEFTAYSNQYHLSTAEGSLTMEMEDDLFCEPYSTDYMLLQELEEKHGKKHFEEYRACLDVASSIVNEIDIYKQKISKASLFSEFCSTSLIAFVYWVLLAYNSRSLYGILSSTKVIPPVMYWIPILKALFSRTWSKNKPTLLNRFLHVLNNFRESLKPHKIEK